jgi:hypothetical protein
VQDRPVSGAVPFVLCPITPACGWSRLSGLGANGAGLDRGISPKEIATREESPPATSELRRVVVTVSSPTGPSVV